MSSRESRRAIELRESLAAKFDLDEGVVHDAVYAVVAAISARLPRTVRAALLSWLPQCWSLLTTGPESLASDLPPARGMEALRERVAEAGVPEDAALPFVAEFIRFLAERCGTPLADTIRRKVPEILAIEQKVDALT